MLHKIVLKVITEHNRLEWRYLCSVPEEIYADFVSAANPDTLDLNAYISLWTKYDWGVFLRMTYTEDIQRLKKLITSSCRRTYSELYIFEDYDLIPDEDFWIKLWVSSHLKSETERLRSK